jgi:osmoprotectant transport system substrate-binding protein
MSRSVRARLAAACALCALVAGCRGEPSTEVVVGVGATAEQRVLAALTVEALERGGVRVRPAEEPVEGRELRRRVESGEVDLFWDYTGAALSLELLPSQPPPAAPEESFERAAREDRVANDLLWLGPTEANATLALFVREAEVAESDRTLTWLSRELSEGGRLCADRDFLNRPQGLRALAEQYSINLEAVEQVPATEDEAIALVASGECDAGLATATSGAADLAGLVPVTDDLGVFPAFVVAPVVRASALEAMPAIRDALAPVLALTTEDLRTLNGRVEAGEEPQAIAAAVLGAAPPSS